MSTREEEKTENAEIREARVPEFERPSQSPGVPFVLLVGLFLGGRGCGKGGGEEGAGPQQSWVGGGQGGHEDTPAGSGLLQCAALEPSAHPVLGRALDHKTRAQPGASSQLGAAWGLGFPQPVAGPSGAWDGDTGLGTQSTSETREE